MPELPDITLYLEALGQRILGRQLKGITLINPFLLRTATPPLASAAGRRVEQLRRVGKRIAIGLEAELWLVAAPDDRRPAALVSPAAARSRGRAALARFEFDSGTLTLTEAGSKRRASLHLLAGEAELARIDPGGLEVFAADLAAFRARLTLRESHAQTRAHRSAAVQRHRQCLLGRDPAPRAPVATGDDAQAHRR